MAYPTHRHAAAHRTPPVDSLDIADTLKCAFYAMNELLALELTIFLEPPVS